MSSKSMNLSFQCPSALHGSFKYTCSLRSHVFQNYIINEPEKIVPVRTEKRDENKGRRSHLVEEGQFVIQECSKNSSNRRVGGGRVKAAVNSYNSCSSCWGVPTLCHALLHTVHNICLHFFSGRNSYFFRSGIASNY